MANRKPTPPSALQVYEEEMREAEGPHDDARREALEQRPLKLQVRKAIRHKHAKRSERVSQPLATRRDTTRKSP